MFGLDRTDSPCNNVSMTKKDYIKIAAVLHAERQRYREQFPNLTSGEIALQRIEMELCEMFKADNPLFSRQRFMLASGGEIPKTA